MPPSRSKFCPVNSNMHRFSPAGCEPLEGRLLLSASESLPVLIGGAAARSVQFTDPNGTRAIVQLAGAGHATVTFNGNGLSQGASPNGIAVSGSNVTIGSIDVTGTTLNSVLRVTTRGASPVTVDSLTSTGVLASILAPGVVMTGDLTTNAWVHQLTLAGAQNGTISIGPSHINGGLILRLGSATDESLDSNIRIDSLTANQWINSVSASQSIVAPQVMNVNVRGNFAPDLTVTGVAGARNTLGSFSAGTIQGGTWSISGNARTLRAGSIANGWSANVAGGISGINISQSASVDLTALTIGSMSVRGALSDSTITLNQPLAPVGFDLNSLSVGGGIVRTTIRSIGSINSINSARMQDSQVYVGLAPLAAGQTLPAAPTDFANVGQIKSLTLRRSASGSFLNSDVAAYGIGNVVLGTLVTGNAGVQFGVAAHSLRSISLTDQATGKSVHQTNVPSTLQFSSVLIARGINPADFVVQIL